MWNGKHPWQMTRADFREAVLDRDPFQLINMDRWLPAHRKAVSGAAARGEDVPAEVLADYPELVRLEYLRGELRAERISYGEIAELQSLAEFIEPADTELLEAAGVPEVTPNT